MGNNQLQTQTSTLTNLTEYWESNVQNYEIPINADLLSIRESPRLTSFLIKENGVVDKSQCYFFITIVIAKLCAYFGVKWSDFQIDEAAKTHYSNFYCWNLLDLRLFQLRCQSGHYGKIFGQFTPYVLMEWAHEYNDEWLDSGAKLAQSKNAEFKAIEKTSEKTGGEWLKSIYEQLLDLKKKGNYVDMSVLRMSQGQYENYLIENIPFASDEDKESLLDALKKEYTVDKEKGNIYLYPKAIEAITESLKK